MAHSESGMLSTFLDDVVDRRSGLISPERVSEVLRLPLAQLARLAQVHRNTLRRHPGSRAVQERLGEVARIITAATDLLDGDTSRAIIWFKHQPLSGFDGRTAEELVAAGQGEAVLTHLEMLRDGVYA
jgi:uncharacterized protein (DUF2384 family)